MNQKILVLIVFTLSIITSLQAQVTWIGGASGDWSVGTNWSSGLTPITTDTIKFTTDVVVTLDVNTTIKAMEVDGPPGTDVIINAGAGNTLVIDGSDVNDAGLRLDDGNFEIGIGLTLELKNNTHHALVVDFQDTLTNRGTLLIRDFDTELGGNDEGLRLSNNCVFYNYGDVIIDDLGVEGGNNSYAFLLNIESTFINEIGATFRVVSPTTLTTQLRRDGMLMLDTSTVINNGLIQIGNGIDSLIERYGIYNLNSIFTNNGTIEINGTKNFGIANDNPGAVFTNNGIIDINNSDDGVLNTRDATYFENNNLITIGNGDYLLIDDYAIRNYGPFHNHDSIIINGTRLQAIVNSDVDSNANFINYPTGVITIDNCNSNAIQSGAGTEYGVFTNDGGLIEINQNGTAMRSSVGLYTDDIGIFINQNGGQIYIDSIANDGIRTDSRDANAMINRGVGSVIHLGLIGDGSIGNGNSSDEGVYCNGNFINEEGARLDIWDATGRNLYINAIGNFINQSGGIVNMSGCDGDAIAIETTESRRLLNTGLGSVINIGQNEKVGNGGSGDDAISNYGILENADGAIINIDKVDSGYAIKTGTGAEIDTLINDGGIINITQNGDTIHQQAPIWIRDTSVFHNLNGGIVNISNVIDYGILFEPQGEFINSGEINITDYEMLASGSDNAIKITDRTWHNDGIIRINDPNTSGFFWAHAINATNCTVTMGPNSNIIVADASMTTGYIGGSGVYFNNCTVTNEGAFTIGNGQTNRIQANGVHFLNSPYVGTATSSFTINGLAPNTNGILISGSEFTSAGTMDMDNVFRGMYCSSNLPFCTNSGSITIGDGTTANVGSFGVFNQTAFTNSGTITTNGTSNDGIRSAHPNASFTNTGTLHLDNSAMNGFTNGLGTNNPSPFLNDGGTINIGQAGANSILQYGLYNAPAGDFTNTNGGVLNLANSSQVLQNEALNGNELLNTNCSIINVDGNTSNSGAFTNEAIINWLSGNFTYTMDIVNTGYMSDPSLMLTVSNRSTGTIDGVSNMGTMMSPMTIECTQNSLAEPLISEATDVSTLSFPIAATWYYDTGLTMPAGTYDHATNTFSFATAPTGDTLETLYFDLGNTNGCSYVGSMIVTVLDAPGCGSCPLNVSLTTNPTDMQVSQASNVVGTTGVVVVESPNMLTLKAGNCIELNPEFEVELGAEFDALIEDCSAPVIGTEEEGQ